MDTVIVPIKLRSKRLPFKPLTIIDGRPLFSHVIDILYHGGFKIYVAIKEKELERIIRDFSGSKVKDVIHVDVPHQVGSEAVYHAAKKLELEKVVNVQGDMFLFSPEIVRAAFTLLEKFNVVTPIVSKLEPNELQNPGTVKTIVGRSTTDPHLLECKWFTRFPVEYGWRHAGIYGYDIDVLREFCSWQRTEAEISESLEQLRFIENGVPIGTGYVPDAVIDVNTEEDLELIRSKGHEVVGSEKLSREYHIEEG